MIGLEIHCQISNLKSKMFCACSADYRRFGPNENVCPVCLGMPGTLPLLNRAAVHRAIAIAKALKCDVPDRIVFFRKNYFYPDLPKNFQITQLDAYGDTCIGGSGTVSIENKKIRIRRIQLEEDPGRIIYGQDNAPQVDYNRAGIPLVEVVTEPDFADPREVRLFLNVFSDIMKNIGVLEEGLDGSLRVDGNISMENSARVELKNISSFYDLEKALEYEITRQTSRIERNMEVIQETRHWDDKRRITTSSRTKEDAADYRYLLEGDIPWITIGPDTVQKISESVPESISGRRDRYISEYGIAPQVADVLAADRFYYELFERSHDPGNARDIANLITTDLMGFLDTRKKREEANVTPHHLADLANAVRTGRISRNACKDILYEVVRTGESVRDAISRTGLESMSDDAELQEIVSRVMAKEAKAVEEAKANPRTVNYLVGMVMKHTRGRADAKTVLNIIREKMGGA